MAFVGALLLHALVLLALSLLDAPVRPTPPETAAIALELRRVPPREAREERAPPEPPPPPPPRPRPRPPSTPPAERPPPAPPDPLEEGDRVFLPPSPSPALEPPALEPPALEPPSLPGPSLPGPPAGSPGPSLLDRVMGTGSRGLPSGLAPDLEDLEGALAFRAPGPESDGARAQRIAQGWLEGAIARHDVRRGMANDYFRRYARVLERQWRPQPAELNDGGRAVSQLGMLEDFLRNPLRWGEYGPKYLEEAYGAWAAIVGFDHTLHHVRDPAAPTTTELRDRTAGELRQALLASLGTRKEALSFEAGAHVRVEHDAQGRVMSIEIVTSSGHARLDEGMREAIVRAAAALGEDAPPGLAGQPFVSEWRMAARWQMTPLRCFVVDSSMGRGGPTAAATTPSMLCATQFDIGPDGTTVEQPFEVKQHTDVELLGVRRP